MKKTLLTNLKFIVIGLVIAISASYAYAAWGGPLTNTFQNNTSAPSAGNTETPLNTGAGDQVKPIGSCAPNNCGGLALGGTFLASKSAEFDGTTFLSGIVGGGSDGSFPASSMLYFGFSGNPTPITVSGALSTTSSLKSTLLANADGTKTLCSDENGVVGFCTVVDMCTNIPGNQDAVPADKQQNADGTCSGAPKRFLSKTQYQEGSAYVGGVTGGQWHYSNPATTNKAAYPFVAQIGLYNGSTSCGTTSNCSEWIYNQIPNIVHTGFSDSLSSLFDNGGAGESGTYHIKISTQGNIGIRGKYSNDGNVIYADFYMKVNGQWIRLDSSSAQRSQDRHEEYPVTGKIIPDFGDVFEPNGDAFTGQGGTGDQFQYAPYSINFDQTIHLNHGDTVNIYALLYGISCRDSSIGDSSCNNFDYFISQQGAVFDITETPDN